MSTVLTANRLYEQLATEEEKVAKYSGRTDKFGFKGLQGAASRITLINEEIRKFTNSDNQENLVLQRATSLGIHLEKKAATEIRLSELEMIQLGKL